MPADDSLTRTGSSRLGSLVKVEKVVKKRSTLPQSQGSQKGSPGSKRAKSGVNPAGFFYGGAMEMSHLQEFPHGQGQQHPFKQEYVPLLGNRSEIAIKNICFLYLIRPK